MSKLDDYLYWRNVAQQLTTLKAKEVKLRRELCNGLFEGRIGSFTVKKDIDDWQITAVSKTTLKLDQEAASAMYGDLTDAEKNSLKSELKIVKKFFDALPADAILFDAITEKPAMPSLKVERIEEEE